MTRFPGIPGLDGLIGLVQAQTQALTALPGAVQALTGAVRGLADAAVQVRETTAAVHRTAVRLDSLVEELEEPLRALAPGLARLAVVLDDPVIDDVPETLRAVQRDVLPVIRTLAETHERVAVIAGSTERIMAFVDETGRSLSGLPGAALLARRRAATRLVDPSLRPDPPSTRGLDPDAE